MRDKLEGKMKHFKVRVTDPALSLDRIRIQYIISGNS